MRTVLLLTFLVVKSIASSDSGSIDFYRYLNPLKQVGEERIIGGKEATPGQFPYQTVVRTSRPDAERLSYCGGVLISEVYVLTAAHCAKGADYIIVSLGAQEVNKDDEPGRINLRVEEEFITVHEAYDSNTIINDIAILKLPEPVQFNEKIQPINLPTRSDVTRNFEALTVIPSGWGKTANDASAVSPVLKYAEVEVLLQTVCRHFYGKTLPDSNICTDTSYGNGVCNGDSGGPLAFTEDNGTKKVLGLSSFVSSYGCVRGFPSVYVRVSSYLDWIAQHSDIAISN